MKKIFTMNKSVITRFFGKWTKVTLVCLLFLIGTGIQLFAQTVTLTATEDVEIWTGDPAKNYGSCNLIYIESVGSTDRGIFRFNLSSIPAGATITGATLTLVKTSGAGSAVNLEVRRMTNNWTEGTGGCGGANGVVNWNQRISGTNWTTPGGDFASTVYATTSVGAATGAYNWNVLTLVQEWYATPSTNLGLMVKNTNEAVEGDNVFASSENTTVANRPKLVITYATVTLSAAVTNVLCRGGSTGAINLTVTGGTTPYTYDWSHNGITQPGLWPDPQDLTGLAAGSYVVYVKDETGSIQSATYTVTQPGSSVSLSTVVSNVTTTGGSNGAIDLTVTGGTPGYTYAWTKTGTPGYSASSKDITGLSAGTYNVTVTDANGCTALISAVVIEATNQTVVNKPLYFHDPLGLSRENPASPVDNTTALTTRLSSSSAAVAVVGSNSVNGDNVASLTVSHNSGTAANRLLLVGISMKRNGALPVVSGVTYGTQTLTFVGSVNNGNNGMVAIYRLINPNSGTYNVVASFSTKPDKGAVMGVTTFSGVDQTTPLGSFGSTTGSSTSPSLNVSSATSEMVFDVLCLNKNARVTPGSGQTERWDNGKDNINGASSTEIGSATTTMSWTTDNAAWALGAVAVKPVAAVNSVTFTETPALCSSLTITSGQNITVSAYMNIMSGSMPANPTISAVLKYGSTTIKSFGNASYSLGILTWTGTIASNVTVPTGQALALQITTTQAGVDFQIRYDSQTYPSKITLPVSTFVNVSSVEVFSGPYPGGTNLTNVPSLGKSYVRVTVTDPFGATDISSVQLELKKPDNSLVNATLTDANVVSTVSCGKIYQYEWNNPTNLGTWDIKAIANEGTEGNVTHSNNKAVTVFVAPDPTVIKPLYLNPSLGIDRSNPADPLDNTLAQTSNINTGEIKTFTQNPALCGNLTIKTGQNITIIVYISAISGTLGTTPSIQAILQYGSTNIITLSTAAYNSGAGTLTWTGALASDMTIPSGQSIQLVVTNNVASSSFIIDYDSSTKPSRIELPISTYVNIGSFDFYNAAYPGGSVITSATHPASVYVRSTVSDPFGFSDITGMNIQISPGSTVPATSVATAGCTRTYEYAWTTPSAGDYSFTATAKEGTENQVVDIYYKSISACPLTVTGTVTQIPSCNVPNSGVIELSVTNGGGPYTYSYTGTVSGSGSGTVISNLIAGTYSITVTSAGGCSGTTSVTVNPPDPIDISLNMMPAGCLGNDGAITSSVSGGFGNDNFTYFWADGYNTSDRSNLIPGNYTLTVTDQDNGCTATQSTTVTQEGEIEADALVISPACNGNSNGSITLSVTGGSGVYTYLWTGPVVISPNNTRDISGLFAGTYTVVITDNGIPACSSTISINVTQPEVLAISEIITPVECFTGGAINLTIAGGTLPYQYDWTDVPGTVNNEDRINIPVGSYTVHVTDANGCTASKSFTLTAPTCDPGSYYACKRGFGANYSAYFAEPVVGAQSYNWTVPEGAVILSGQGTTSVVVKWADVVAFPARAEICVAAVNDCGESAKVCRTVYIRVGSASADASLACTGKEFQLSASGGVTYQWSGVAPLSYSSALQNPKITNAAHPANSGTYKVLVTDAYGCEAEAIVDVTVNPSPSVTSLITNAACGEQNGEINITASGGTPGYTYQWLGGQRDEDLTDLGAGVYNVTVTDTKGCEAELTSVVNSVDGPTLTMSQTNISCFGQSNGSATATPAGGTAPYTYLWSNGKTTSIISGVKAGYYTVTITDALGCIVAGSVTITQPEPLVTDYTVGEPKCKGGSTGSINITSSGGTSPYTYDWAHITGTNDIEDLTNIPAGVYTITVRDANGCSNVESITVGEPSEISIALAKLDVSCFGGSTGAVNSGVGGGIGPYLYAWTASGTGSVPSGQSGNPNLTMLTAGTYTLQVTDANFCTKTASIEVFSPSPVQVNTPVVTNVLCFGTSTGAIDITPSGGQSTTYTYQWSHGAVTQDVTNLPAGTYTVIVRDIAGCSVTSLDIMVTQPNQLTATATPDAVDCYGDASGSITVGASGGTSPWSYSKTGGAPYQPGAVFSDLVAGIYNITVKDNNNCLTTVQAVVTQPEQLSVGGVVNNARCFGASNGAIDISVAGGTEPYTYDWEDTGTPGLFTDAQDRSGLLAGTYTVNVKDATNCIVQKIYTVGQPTLLTASAIGTNVTCKGAANGSIDLTVSGGTAPYGYAWSNGDGVQDPSGLIPGSYTVTVIDANGCTASAGPVSITEPNLLTLTGVKKDNCDGLANGEVTLTASGGNGSFQYSKNGVDWQSENIFNGLAAGTYTFQVKDAKNCTAVTEAITLAAMTATITAIPVTSCAYINTGIYNGEVYPNIVNGKSPFSYVWTASGTGEVPATQEGNPYLQNVRPGTYQVVITDFNGCTFTVSGTVTQTITCQVPVAVDESYTACGSSQISGNIATNDQDDTPTELEYITFEPSPVHGTFTWTVDTDGEKTGAFTFTPEAGYSGTIEVTYRVEDPTGLSDDGKLTIYVSQLSSTVTAGNTTHVNCGATNGSATVTVDPASATYPPYVYEWKNASDGIVGTNSATLSGVGAGTYTVKVTDVKGCNVTTSVTIQNVCLTITKTLANINGNATKTTYNALGDVLNYNIVVTNTGTATLSNTVVTDPVTGMNQTITSLAPAASQSFVTSYTIVSGDLIAGSKLNTATASYSYNGANYTASDNETVNAQVPDLSPIIKVDPNIMNGPTSFYIFINVYELNNGPTNGNTVTVRVTLDKRATLSYVPGGFNGNATTIGTTPVNNSNWNMTIDNSDPNSLILVFATRPGVVIGAKGLSVIGLEALWSTAAEYGSFTVTSTIDNNSGGEIRNDNNVDSEKADFFIGN